MIKLKDIIKESKWSDRKWGDPLPTLEDYMTEAEVDDDTEIKFKVTDKDGKPTGETDSMPASSAKKLKKTHPAKIEYDKLAKKGGEDKPEEPSGKLGGGDFERETEPERGEKPKAKRSDRYKDVDTSWQDDPDAVAAQGQQGRWPGQDEPTEPKGGEAKEITKDMKSIASSGGNNVLMHKGTADHIERHNKPGEGSVFSDDISMDDVQNAISEIPEEFYEKGGGVHTTTVPNAGYNLVQKASDIKKDHPNAKKIMVKKQVGYDRDKKEPIMKEVPAYIIDDDKEKFKTDQLSVVVRPSNPDFMDDEVKNNSDVKKDLDGKKSHSVITSFPGDPDVPKAEEWEESGHAIIIPNGGKDADKTNWVEEPEEVDNPFAEIEFDPSDPAGWAEKVKAQAGEKEKALKYLQKRGVKVDYDRMASDPEYAQKMLKGSGELSGIGKKESLTINGKQYKRISESVEPTIFDPLKEAKKQLGSLYSRMIGK